MDDMQPQVPASSFGPPQAFMPAPAPQPAAAAPTPDQAGAKFDMDPATASKAFQDPAFLKQAAMIFLDAGLPEGVQWLERSHTAAKEGAIDAMQKLEAGDADGAIQAFNTSGQYRDATGATKNGDGTWTLTRKSGAPVTLDPVAMRKSFLSPKDYFAQMTADRNAKTQEGYRADQADHYRRLDANNAEAIDARSEAARARGEGAATAAAAKADAEKYKADLNNKHSYDAVYQQNMKDLLAGGTSADEAPAKAQFLARSQFTDVRQAKDGSYAVIDRSSGTPQKLGSFPDFKTANTAAMGWVKGTGMPAAADTAKPGAKPAAAPSAPAVPFEPPADRPTRRLAKGSAEQKEAAAARKLGASPEAPAAASLSFDADVGSMKPEDFAAKYDGQRGSLTNDQLRKLNEIVKTL